MATVTFYINGEQHTVLAGSLPATTSLNEYIREKAGLRGTKVMCREAGCGCCAVTVSHCPPDSDVIKTYSVQSCVTPLYAVDGWQISTVEGIGGQKKGFHPIQERIAKFNGTQCGYCTPGMVMNMYGLLHQKPNISAQDVEDNFDGNICRCTGYRPILDAMKSFAHDSNIPEKTPIDIEDLNKNLCPKTGEACSGTCKPHSLDLELTGARWHRPINLGDLCELIKANKDKKFRLVFGNTSTGIYKDDGPYMTFIDLHEVKELFFFEMTSESMRLGAATTLTRYLDRLKENQDKDGFGYFGAIHRHIKVVANVMVRNSGCIAGNLMVKYWHKEFPSDLFTTLEAAGASVEICDADSKRQTVSLLDFLTKVDMSDKVITAVILPRHSDNVVYRSFKITPRWQNAHAYVNAAFKIPVTDLVIKGRPSIVLGGISAKTVHATKTEDYLTDKTICLPVIKGAYSVLKDELVPHESPLESSAQFRKDLAGGLLYKTLLGLFKQCSAKVRSGAEDLHRPVSSGLQTYKEVASEFPLKQGMTKKTSSLQASGEAVFINDIPKYEKELYAAFVVSDVASAGLGSLDASEALSMQGVTHFFTAKDICGANNTTPPDPIFPIPPHELFVSTDVMYAGQPVGLILAESQTLADAAAKKVKVNYSKVGPAVTNLKTSMAAGIEIVPARLSHQIGGPEEALKACDQVVEGTVSMGSQYHFFMESHVSLAVPSEDGIDLFAATQYADTCQLAAALVIGQPCGYINLTVPRLGGAFGGKILDAYPVSCAVTLAAYLTNRPVRCSLDLASVFRICGKRPPFEAKYKVGFTKEGKLDVIDLDFAMEGGYTPLAAFLVYECLPFLDMGYHVPNWNIVGRTMWTNKRTMTLVRAPGSVPAALMIESILEHVAKSVNKHPILVKEINLFSEGQVDITGHVLNNCTLREMWHRLKDVAEVDGRIRQVDAFNSENLWKKQGITMTSCKYGMHYIGSGQNANVSIIAKDGSVVVLQSGVEMGQGLYTKVAQAVAHVLGIPMETIKVRPNQFHVNPNSIGTSGSVGSEVAMQASIQAAEILKERMAPIREKFPDASWKELCEHCIANKVDLAARSQHVPAAGSPKHSYFTYCIAAVETEIDVITGESQIKRVDIMADLGESLNPVIDIGQTEGGFVMGLGNYLTEDCIYDLTTGQILSDGTWTYKPPTTKDIPIDWRVHLLPDSQNPGGIRSSKASGEPSTGLAVGALLANKLAIQSARKDLFNFDDFIPVVAPFTVERAQQSLGLSEEVLTL